jgi:hypothetical protein
MDAKDRELLTSSLRSLLSAPDVDVSAELDELGWDEVLADDLADATTLLFTEHGRARAASSVLDQVLLAELPVAAGTRRAVLYAVVGEVVTDEGVLLADPAGVDEIVVPVLGGVAVVAATGLTVREVAGFDTGRGWRVARLTDAEPDPGVGARDWEAAVAAGRRALAAELNGITEVTLEIAVRHTSERVQYGRAIASYQTVRLRLAEGHAMLVASRSLLSGAWTDGAPWAAAAAKAQAGHAYLEVARHAMQLCGAIGLTREHELHRYVERGAVLDALLGSARELTHALGVRLLDGYRPPSVVEL